MAFVILDNNKFCKVARNETDKNDMNINPRTGSEVTISDDDFNAYVTGQKEIIVTDGNVTTQLQTYIGVLSSTDTSSLSYPINWEKHCSDNSITFLHVNQIG